ncbi:MAG: hypothetical protein H7836_05665 [Magnetococcus sp. YQC-3]
MKNTLFALAILLGTTLPAGSGQANSASDDQITASFARALQENAPQPLRGSLATGHDALEQQVVQAFWRSQGTGFGTDQVTASFLRDLERNGEQRGSGSLATDASDDPLTRMINTALWHTSPAAMVIVHTGQRSAI